jgi:hypothetical protein
VLTLAMPAVLHWMCHTDRAMATVPRRLMLQRRCCCAAAAAVAGGAAPRGHHRGGEGRQVRASCRAAARRCLRTPGVPLVLWRHPPTHTHNLSHAAPPIRPCATRQGRGAREVPHRAHRAGAGRAVQRHQSQGKRGALGVVWCGQGAWPRTVGGEWVVCGGVWGTGRCNGVSFIPLSSCCASIPSSPLISPQFPPIAPLAGPVQAPEVGGAGERLRRWQRQRRCGDGCGAGGGRGGGAAEGGQGTSGPGGGVSYS